MSPVKKFLSEKDKLLSDLSIGLHEKTEEISKIQELNHFLKDKLMEYQRQNEENVKLYRDQTMDTTVKNRELAEKQKVLEMELAKNAEKINELLVKNYALTKSNKTLEDYEIKVLFDSFFLSKAYMKF